MLDTLHGVGRWLVHDLGWISVEILGLTAIVWVVIRWGGVRSSRARRWLWTLVVLKPLTALLIGWPLPSDLGQGPGIRPIAAVETPQVANVPSLADAVPAYSGQGDGADPRPATASAPPADSDPVTRAGADAVTGFAVLGALWLTGCAALCAHTLVGVWWLWHVQRQAVALGRDELLVATDRHREDIGELLAELPVRLTTRLTEPCIYGFFRPVILLPAWCLEDTTPANLEYILLHEAMHRRAADHWFLWLRRAIEVFVWFHPAVWYAGRKAMAEAENVCDEAVVDLAHRRGEPAAALAYSACLMSVLEHAKRRPFAGLAPGIVATAARIRHLVEQTEASADVFSRRSVVGVVALAVVALPGAIRGDAALASRAYQSATHKDPPAREILYATRYPSDYFRNLYIVRSDGTRPKRITDDRAYYVESSWSPDGALIAAACLRPGSPGWRSWMHDAEGNVLYLIGEPEWGLRNLAWTPDGSALYGAGQPSTDSVRNIYLIDRDGSVIRRLTDDSHERRAAAPSPDGSALAITTARVGRVGYEIVLVNMETEESRTAPGSGVAGVREGPPAWSPDGSQLAYIAAGDTVLEMDELRILDVRTLQSTAVGKVSTHMAERERRVDWYPHRNSLLLVDKRDGDTRYHTYRLDLDTGRLTRLSSTFGEGVMASVGPVASPSRPAEQLVTPPVAYGPATHPVTGHVYYAVLTARRISYDEAAIAAAGMRHAGQTGYLACIGSEEENRYLLAEFPLTHHGFWLGGYAERAELAGSPYEWTWANGDAWGFTSWQDDASLKRAEWAPGAAMTWSLRVGAPERAGEEDHHMWAVQDPSHEELGFIVEFDPISVSSTDRGAPRGRRYAAGTAAPRSTTFVVTGGSRRGIFPIDGIPRHQ